MTKKKFLLRFYADVVDVINIYCVGSGISRSKFFRELVDSRLNSNKSNIKKVSEIIKEKIDEKTKEPLSSKQIKNAKV